MRSCPFQISRKLRGAVGFSHLLQQKKSGPPSTPLLEELLLFSPFQLTPMHWLRPLRLRPLAGVNKQPRKDV